MWIFEWPLGWFRRGAVVPFDRVGYVIRPDERNPKKALKSTFSRVTLQPENGKIILRAKH